jgi:hypothetical protein
MRDEKLYKFMKTFIMSWFCENILKNYYVNN